MEEASKHDAEGRVESLTRERLRQKRGDLEEQRAKVAEMRHRVEERRAALESLKAKTHHGDGSDTATLVTLADGVDTVDVEQLVSVRQQLMGDLRKRKQELIVVLFGLLPIAMHEGKLRIVNYHNLDPSQDIANMPADQAGAIAEHLVKLTMLMARYLEVSLPNVMERRDQRWMIRQRPTLGNVEPVWFPLHPRTQGVEPFKAGMNLMAQNIVRLSFEHGIIVTRGHEHECALNLLRLVSYAEGANTQVGIGYDPPFTTYVSLPELDDDQFILVSSKDK